MAIFAPDSTLDGMLDTIANDGLRVHICSTQPTTYTEAVTTYNLATVTTTAGDGGGDWTIANGDTSGRKLTLAQQTGVSISTSGTAQHIAVTDATDTLYLVTTCTSQAVTSGNTATINAVDFELRDLA